MMHEIINGEALPKFGPYSPAVRAGGLIFVSAQVGVDPVTGTVPPGGFEAECRQVLTNLAHVLGAAGADLSRVVKTTVFYTDVTDLPTINRIYAEAFATDPPARASAIVELAGGLRISVDAIAAA